MQNFRPIQSNGKGWFPSSRHHVDTQQSILNLGKQNINLKFTARKYSRMRWRELVDHIKRILKLGIPGTVSKQELLQHTFRAMSISFFELSSIFIRCWCLGCKAPPEPLASPKDDNRARVAWLAAVDSKSGSLIIKISGMNVRNTFGSDALSQGHANATAQESRLVCPNKYINTMLKLYMSRKTSHHELQKCRQ